MNIIDRGLGAIDVAQRRNAFTAVLFASIKKFGDDQAASQAALLAYYGLFALFPLLLLFTTVLGWLLPAHPRLREQVLHSTLADFPIIGSQLQGTTTSLHGSVIAVVVGVLGILYGAQGIGQAAQNAMNAVWNVPLRDRPNFLMRRLRGYAWLFGLGLASVVSTVLAGYGNRIIGGIAGWLWSQLVPLAINLGVFYVVFTVLTALPLRWRDVWLGVVLATCFWQLLQLGGGLYVRHTLSHASDVYGFFAIVIGLLSWLFLAAQLTLLAAEVNVVVRERLWPRSIVEPRTDADRAVDRRLALMAARSPEIEIVVSFRTTPTAPAETPTPE